MSKTSGPAGWTEEVSSIYKDMEEPKYIQNMETPMRETYPTPTMKETELLSTLVEVVQTLQMTQQIFNSFLNKYSLNLQKNVYYNMFERDLAVVNIFFGEATAIGNLIYQYHFSNLFLLQNTRKLLE